MSKLRPPAVFSDLQYGKSPFLNSIFKVTMVAAIFSRNNLYGSSNFIPDAFRWTFTNFPEQLHYRTPPGYCFLSMIFDNKVFWEWILWWYALRPDLDTPSKIWIRLFVKPQCLSDYVSKKTFNVYLLP